MYVCECGELYMCMCECGELYMCVRGEGGVHVGVESCVYVEEGWLGGGGGGTANSCADTFMFPRSLVPRPRGRREKWPGIHCLRMRERFRKFFAN